jgi:hypothetical protein
MRKKSKDIRLGKVRRAIPRISPKSQRIVDYHAQDQIIGNNEGILNYFFYKICLISTKDNEISYNKM